MINTQQTRATNLSNNPEILDLKVFERIPSQTSDNDKRSLLACRSAVSNLQQPYIYLEIGSYLGGSLQPFLLDKNCLKIYSIDKRPVSQPDERGVNFVYQNNSTERMLDNLRKVSPDLSKIVCLDGDVSEIETGKIEQQPNFCFIDGEHTDTAVWNDFQFCLKVMEPNGVIAFHDAAVIYKGLQNIINFLQEKKIKFHAYNLPDIMFVIEIGEFPVHCQPHIQQLLVDNYVGYLSSLQANDSYRVFARRLGINQYHKFRVWLNGSNISK